jgi:hypothetical protein
MGGGGGGVPIKAPCQIRPNFKISLAFELSVP